MWRLCIRYGQLRQFSVTHIRRDPSNVLEKTFLFARFGKNIFTKNSTEGDEKFDGDFKMNPLFTMTKSEILDLNGLQYRKLARLPMELIQDSQHFCINIVQIVEDKLLKNQKLVASLIDNIGNEELKQVIISSLRRVFNSNKIKLSFIEALDSVESERFRTIFTYLLETIMQTGSEDPKIRIEMLLNYLYNLACLGSINPTPIIVEDALFEMVIQHTPASRLGEFYSYCVNLNLVPNNRSIMARLQKILSRGSQLDQYILRTGEINAKWHDTVKPLVDDRQRQRLLNFLPFELIRLFAYQAIKRKDIVDANFYLDLLVTKFESTCAEIEDSVFVIENSKEVVTSHVQSILKVVLFHIMTFKGGKSCINILEYIVKNDLEVKVDLLTSMIRTLTEQGFYDEAITIVNTIQLDKILGREKKELVDHIFKLMSLKFSNSPKVLLSYSVSLFRNLRPDHTVLHELNDLQILGLLSGSKDVKPVAIPPVTPALIDSRLTGVSFTHANLCDIYRVALKSVTRADLSPEVISRLFTAYIDKLQTTLHKYYNSRKVNDEIVTILLNYLMKYKPEDQFMNLIKHKDNYDVAKYIMTSFHKAMKFIPGSLKPYPFELMIYSSLLHHNDPTWASLMIKTSMSHHIPFTLNQIYPFIIYFYRLKDYKTAESWYKLLVSNGVKAKTSDMKEVYRIARELQWDTKGFVYKKNIIKKNKVKQEAIQNVDKDHLSFLKTQPKQPAEEASFIPKSAFKEQLTILLSNIKTI